MDEFTHRKWRARIKKRRGKSLNPGVIRELNLVAMMDMLTVVLVFLLKSYSVSAMSIPVGNEIQIPQSTNKIRPEEAIKLTVTKLVGDNGVIAIDEQVVLKLDSKTLAGLESQARTKRNFLIKDLHSALVKKADTIKAIAKQNPSIKFEGKVMVIADKAVPYWLITEVLYTAAEAQFEQYNLVAMAEVQE